MSAEESETKRGIPAVIAIAKGLRTHEKTSYRKWSHDGRYRLTVKRRAILEPQEHGWRTAVTGFSSTGEIRTPCKKPPTARAFAVWSAKVQERDFNIDVSTVLPRKVGMSLFGVRHVSLHNGVRQRGAGQVKVELQGVSSEIQLIVSDSGTGFDVESALGGCDNTFVW